MTFSGLQIPFTHLDTTCVERARQTGSRCWVRDFLFPEPSFIEEEECPSTLDIKVEKNEGAAKYTG